MSHDEHPLVRQEPDAVPRARVGLIALVGVVVFLAALGVAALVQQRTAGSLRGSHGTVVRTRAPQQIGIVDQTLIVRDRLGLRLRRQQAQALEGYGWVDRAHGIARRPIREAMDQVVREAQGDGGTPP